MNAQPITDGSTVDAGDSLRDSRGRIVDDDYVNRALSHARGPGRPSLTGQAEASPQIVIRLTPELRRAAEAAAEARGVTLSALTRDALAAYLHLAS